MNFDLYIVHGMKRSGNHAIIHWMLQQSTIMFFNNAFPIRRFFNPRHPYPFPADYSLVLERLRRRWRLRSFWIENILRAKKKILSIEDHFLDLTFFHNAPPGHANVLILRDPYNLFASRIRKGNRTRHPDYPREYNDIFIRAVKLWKQSFREFVGETNYLSRKICISYDRWVIDAEYRRALLALLGLEVRDNGIGSLAAEGGGSSFGAAGNVEDPTEYLQRFTQLNEQEERLFSRILEDAELREMRRQITQLYAAGRESRQPSR